MAIKGSAKVLGMVISPNVPICVATASPPKAGRAMASVHRRWDRVTVNALPSRVAMASVRRTVNVMGSVPKVVRAMAKANAPRCARVAHVRKVVTASLTVRHPNAVRKADAPKVNAKAMATAHNVPRWSRSNLQG